MQGVSLGCPRAMGVCHCAYVSQDKLLHTVQWLAGPHTIEGVGFPSCRKHQPHSCLYLGQEDRLAGVVLWGGGGRNCLYPFDTRGPAGRASPPGLMSVLG